MHIHLLDLLLNTRHICVDGFLQYAHMLTFHMMCFILEILCTERERREFNACCFVFEKFESLS